jgi:hypothetical protein
VYSVKPVTNSSYLHPEALATSRGIVRVFTKAMESIERKYFHNDNIFRHSFHSFPYPNKNPVFSMKERVKYCVNTQTDCVC